MTNEFFLRISLTFLLALLFGLERQKAHKQVGFGTFIFVATGACALSIISLDLFAENPLPLLGAIVTGIGFLGAGALIRDQDKIFGFTTAASIWVFAILGITIGVGHYLFGILLYLMIWIIIFIDKKLEKKGVGSYRTKLSIETNRIVEEVEIRKFLLDVGIKNTKMIRFEIINNKSIHITYFIEGKSSEIKKIPEEASKNKWIEIVKFE